ncbi:DME family drug/metabolite transporter [Thermocatellispora tengchongensis]|uniref:DME family drug/metabolite transporter n=1 Tax=Thermocatellispora tengchongensis TaxID=1073253 RepID=A0A840PAA7_9ACTN|nr:EamA family transporter [Thermocatellispora tengchongensis]MBB5136578.1 DME family drug/metabolite transporter [Thermocatellispora tengchongensis]
MTHVSVRRGLLYVSLAATAWGTGGAAAALLYRIGDLGPVAVSFWRLALGAALLAAVHRPRPAANVRHLLTTGVGMAVYQTAYFAAVAESGLAVATVVTLGATPVLVAAGARVRLGERPGAYGTAGLAAALAGLLLLTRDDGSGAFSAAGLAWSLLSAAGYAGVTMANRAVRDDPYGNALGGMAVGSACLLPFALAEGAFPVAVDSWPAVLALLAYLGAVPTALAYGLFFAGLTAVRATTASVVVLVEPVGAALIGVLVLGERMTPLSWAGAALLVLAAALPALSERR